MKKKVFLTGATGHMGWATMNEFLKYRDLFDVTILARKSEKNRKLLASYSDKVNIVWGELTVYEDVLNFFNK